MKLMITKTRRLNILMVTLTTFGFFACSVVSLDSGLVPLGPDDSIIFEDIYPASAEVANDILTGSSTRSWSSKSFTIEEISGLQQCRLDDQIVIDMDGTFSFDGGDLLCGAEDNTKIKNGSWALDYTARTITFTPADSDPIALYIEMLTGTEIVISSSYVGLEVVGKFGSN